MTTILRGQAGNFVAVNDPVILAQMEAQGYENVSDGVAQYARAFGIPFPTAFEEMYGFVPDAAWYIDYAVQPSVQTSVIEYAGGQVPVSYADALPDAPGTENTEPQYTWELPPLETVTPNTETVGGFVLGGDADTELDTWLNQEMTYAPGPDGSSFGSLGLAGGGLSELFKQPFDAFVGTVQEGGLIGQHGFGVPGGPTLIQPQTKEGKMTTGGKDVFANLLAQYGPQAAQLVQSYFSDHGSGTGMAVQTGSTVVAGAVKTWSRNGKVAGGLLQDGRMFAVKKNGTIKYFRPPRNTDRSRLRRVVRRFKSDKKLLHDIAVAAGMRQVVHETKRPFGRKK